MANTSETNAKSELSLLSLNNATNNKIVQEEEEEQYYAYTLQLITSCALPMVLKSITEMGVLKIIYDHAGVNGLSSAEIANRVQIQNPEAPSMLDRMLQLLATYLVVKCTALPTTNGGLERRYSPTPVTKFLVPDNDNLSLAAFLNMFADKVFLDIWSKLTKATLEGGIPFNMVHGMNTFEYPGVDSRYDEIFNQGMYQTSTFAMKKILQKYKGFENIGQLVDVGGGLGHSLRIITSRYPLMKAINFDLPHVIVNALPCPGVEHVSGDMFECIPKGDAIFMKWILQDWSDDHCLKLLKNCYKALPESGKVIVVEAVITGEAECTPSSRTISQLDVTMMVQSLGGKERNMKEFEALAKAAGFASVNFDCFVYNLCVIELYKK